MKIGLKQNRSTGQLGNKSSNSLAQMGLKSYGFNSHVTVSNVRGNSANGLVHESNGLNQKNPEPTGLNVKSTPKPKPMDIERKKKPDPSGYGPSKNFLT
jgi:hypothetical protein